MKITLRHPAPHNKMNRKTHILYTHQYLSTFLCENNNKKAISPPAILKISHLLSSLCGPSAAKCFLLRLTGTLQNTASNCLLSLLLQLSNLLNLANTYTNTAGKQNVSRAHLISEVLDDEGAVGHAWLLKEGAGL